jgi:hypothetical protein
VPQPRGRAGAGAPPSTPLPGVPPVLPQPAPKTPPGTPACALLPPPAPDNVAAAYEINTIELAPAVAALEVQMRAAVAARSTVHVTKRTVLLRAFGKVSECIHMCVRGGGETGAVAGFSFLSFR